MVTINGTPNNDTLPGTAGDDFFDGLSGVDTAQIGSPSSGAVFSRDAQGRWVVTSGQGVDTLAGIERVSLNGEIFTFGRNEVLVNTTTDHDQTNPSMTALSDGGWLVCWASREKDHNGLFRDGIFQRRYATDGIAMGGETRVSPITSDSHYDSSVAALADGGWLVTWTSNDGNGAGIFQQRYTSIGAPFGTQERVNTITNDQQDTPSVAALADGGWLIGWTSWAADGSGSNIYQQRYTSTGATAGAEARVNTTRASDQSKPCVTMLTDGGWLVSWQSMNQEADSFASGWGIYQQRYTAVGAAIGGEARVNSTISNDQRNPSVTALGDGGWLVSWMSLNQDGSGFGVYQQRYTAAGAPIGGETRVNSTTASFQQDPGVAALTDGGWLVSWTAYNQDGDGWGIYQQRYSVAGTAVSSETLVNTNIANDQQAPTVTSLSDGGWLVSWQSSDQDGSGWGILQQRYDASGNPIGGDTLITGDASANRLMFNGSVAIELAGEGGADTLLGGSGNDTLSGGYGSDTAMVPVPQTALAWSLTADGRLLVASAATGSDELRSVERVQTEDGTISVGYAATTESRVNATTANHQDRPSVTGLSDGGWLVIWMSDGQDGGGYGIRQQRYTAAGDALGAESQVNSFTANDQENPSVTALGDGGWLVSWMSDKQDGSGHGIYQQRYSSAGAAVGVEGRVNTTTADQQQYPNVAALGDGGWLVSWMANNQDGSGYGVYQQRYSAAGWAVGGENRVNMQLAQDQKEPSVVALGDGGWLVTWMSNYGSSYDIYQQRYTSAGLAIGGEILVNTNKTNDQTDPCVTALVDGGWLVTWMSRKPQSVFGEDYSVCQQRYTSNGVADGPETLITTIGGGGSAEHPDVTALADGGWVVTWASRDVSGNDIFKPETVDIYQQRYTSGGLATGAQARVNTAKDLHADFPSVTGLRDGGWLVSWMSFGQDGSLGGIYQQRFDASGLRDGHLTLTGDSNANTLRMATATAGVELIGGSGNDTLAGGTFADTFDGGAGLDTGAYSTRHAAYTVAPAGSGWSISGPDGTDTLTGIERLQFQDAHLGFDINANAGQVYRLYKAAFARTPDLGGLGGWIAGMDSGLTLEQVANSFIASAEFQSLYGASSSNGQFVTALYLNVMGRAPDAGGYGYWVNQLASSLQTRAQVLVAFSESAENKSATAGLTANGILYASAEQAAGPARGQTFDGTPGMDTLMGSVGADTFNGAAGNDSINGGAGIDISLYGGSKASHTITRSANGLTVSGGTDGTDTLVNVERLKFADIALAFDLDGNAGQTYRLYQAAFDRTPDTPGLSDWIRGMDGGMSLKTVASGFIGSAEFQGLYGANPTNTQFIDLLYSNVLNRAPDQAGYDYWLGQMAGGMTRELVLIGFSESAENQAALLPVIQGGIGYLA